MPSPQRPVLRNIVVRDVHLREADTVGKFFTIADAPIDNFTLSNITIEPKVGAKKPGWTCAAWGKGNGREEHGRVHACGASAAEAIAPALAQPGGCAFSCAKNSIKTDDATVHINAEDGNGSALQSCAAIKSATVVACEPIVVATFPSDAVLPPNTNPWNASAHIWAAIQERSGVSLVRVGGYFDNGSVSFRFTPLKAGRYTVTLHRRDNLPVPPPCSFIAVAGPKPNCGFVRVGRNKQHFAVSEQQSWFGIGENLAWVAPVAGKNSHGSLQDWDPFLRNLSVHGANYIRVWLTDSAWDDMAVETALGNYSIANTARIESLLKSCDTLGIKVLMTIESFNYLCVCKKRKPGGCTSPCYFDKFAYNVNHPGGFLHNPAEFFNTSLADEYTFRCGCATWWAATPHFRASSPSSFLMRSTLLTISRPTHKLLGFLAWPATCARSMASIIRSRPALVVAVCIRRCGSCRVPTSRWYIRMVRLIPWTQLMMFNTGATASARRTESRLS